MCVLLQFLTVRELFSPMAERVPAIKIGRPEPIGCQADVLPSSRLGLAVIAHKAKVGGYSEWAATETHNSL